MDTFYTLEEFLLLNESEDEKSQAYKRSIHESFRGLTGFDLLPDAVRLWRIAKLNWETYGDLGPPVDSTVYTLHSGFGCSGPWVARTVKENRIYSDKCFVITDSNQQDYLVQKDFWWTQITTREILEKLNDPRIIREFRFGW